MSSAVRGLAAALACVFALGAAYGARAQGGVQIDTAAFSTVSPTLCVLGQACGSSYNLGFSLGLGDGTTFNKVYIYKEGVIGLGSALPTGATFGDLGSLGGAYMAPAFGDFTGLDVHVTFALAGGGDHGLQPFVNDDVLIDWYVFNPAAPVGAQRGEFQIKFHTDQYGTGNDPPFAFRYGGNLNDPNAGAQGLYWPGDGKPAGALVGSNLSGALPGVPEPETWALLVGGFALVGLMRRRRRRGLTIA